ncbi:MAG: acyl-CoA thioesterase [Rhodobacteraceae bacterium]|nr:MAG: acyl-CoA thioesterase [Paracoccaceae bacterium]
MNLRYHTPLSPDEQRAFGLAAPQPLALADRVRFAELDVLRHVNNKAYMTWFETLRVVYGDLFTLPLYPSDSPPPRVVIRSGHVHYVEEMRMGEDYVTTAGVTAFRNTSYTMHQELWAAGRLRASFDCVIVTLLPDGSGRYPLPEAVRAHFARVDGAVAEG